MDIYYNYILMSGQYKKYISEKEEVRDGFLVTSNRKKVRNVQLGLLEEFKRICEKYNLKYYADGGTMLGAIRHGGFIPWDDDIDIAMPREHYERFLEIAKNELEDYIKIRKSSTGFVKLVNINTSALGDDNRWDEDYIGGIRIDIFPLDYGSKYFIINWIKSRILIFLHIIYFSQKSYCTIYKIKRRTRIFPYVFKYLFKYINCSKLLNIYDIINKKVFFKGKKICTGYYPYRFFPDYIYNNSYDEQFENTIICIPEGYDTYLKLLYGDYTKPVIRQGGHSCRYSVDKSYKDIIKTFDRSKTNEENYNNCEYLFEL